MQSSEIRVSGVGKCSILGSLAQAELGLGADIQHARLAEGLKEPVEEDLGLAFLIAGDVLLNPGGEFRKLCLARHGRFTGASAGMSASTRPPRRVGERFMKTPSCRILKINGPAGFFNAPFPFRRVRVATWQRNAFGARVD